MLLAYLALFGVSFAAATVLPLGSEAALVALVLSERSLLAPVLIATLGNVLGSATTFWLGWRAGALATTHKPKLAARMARASTILQRWGTPVLLLAWFPVVGDMLVAVAGALRLPPTRSLLWITLGKAGRYVALGWAALLATSG